MLSPAFTGFRKLSHGGGREKGGKGGGEGREAGERVGKEGGEGEGGR